MIPKEIEQAAANLADPNICKTDNWIAGAMWQKEKQLDLLIDFQFYLNQKKLITDYDWVFEKEAANFLKKLNKK